MISDHLSREQSRGLYAPGTEFHIGKIEMAATTRHMLVTITIVPAWSVGVIVKSGGYWPGGTGTVAMLAV